jgi:predicted HTH transcriptional regulator
VVHRDYSLTGKDVKVAVYDDMVEITSPGLLPPSIDYDAMESRQSDARNKIIAPVFKRMGIIDQWGNGLKLIFDELKDYPNIELRWKEVGLSFQVQFVKSDYVEEQAPPENTRKTPRKHPEKAQKTPRKHPENTQKHPENTQKHPETPRSVQEALLSGCFSWLKDKLYYPNKQEKNEQ